MSHAINSHVLTGETPYINQAINVLLMHGFITYEVNVYIYIYYTSREFPIQNFHRRTTDIL